MLRATATLCLLIGLTLGLRPKRPKFLCRRPYLRKSGRHAARCAGAAFPRPGKTSREGARVPRPEGTTNVALNKKVTSSDANPVLGELKYVTDGQKEGTEESYVELGPLEQWVQIDLEKPCAIYAVYVWHFFREARSYHDVILQVADDAAFKQNVRTVYSNDQDNSSGKGIGKARPYIETNLGKLLDGKGVTARYVRLYSRGNTANDLNHYVEVEVFGKPAP